MRVCDCLRFALYGLTNFSLSRTVMVIHLSVKQARVKETLLAKTCDATKPIRHLQADCATVFVHSLLIFGRRLFATL